MPEHRAPQPPAEQLGEHASRRFIEFFTATIRNPNTRHAYSQAVSRFLAWCGTQGIADIRGVQPVVIAAYIEQLIGSRSVPTVKQHLAALRMLFDWMVSGGVLPDNPAASVRGPRRRDSASRSP